jgi:hypothetical protein
MAVVFDPGRPKARDRAREVAIADTYTLIVRPQIEHIHQSLQP